MDPLTHTLLGASLAATRLGRVTPLAPAAWIVGANLPDVDVLAYAWGQDAAIGFRRGWTHGILALVVLPLLLAGALLAWDRLVRRRRRPHLAPARGTPLLAVSGLAILTHPALDWLNTYGMRWWMPFDGRWSYGDAVFIMDPWLWLILGVPLLLVRRRTIPLLVAWGVVSLLLTLVTWSRSPEHLAYVAASVVVLLLAALRRPPASRHHWRVAAVGLLVATVYVGAMVTARELATPRARAALEAQGWEPIAQLLVGPLPATPWAQDVLARAPEGYVHGRWHWLPSPHLQLAPNPIEPLEDSPLWPRVRDNPGIQGYLTWARFPWVAVEATEDPPRTLLLDARYAREPERGPLTLEVPSLGQGQGRGIGRGRGRRSGSSSPAK